MANNTCSCLLRLFILLSCVLLALSSKTHFGKYTEFFKGKQACPPCNLRFCPKLEEVASCQELIHEYPLCPCCFQCARELGEPCGFKHKCGTQMICDALPEDIANGRRFEALREGRGVCVPHLNGFSSWR